MAILSPAPHRDGLSRCTLLGGLYPTSSYSPLEENMSDTVRLALLTGGIILIAIAIIAGAVLISQWIRQRSVMKQGAAKGATGSCIGSGVLIVGSVECNGPFQVFGRIEGDLRALDLLIDNGAHVEGSVIAEDVTVCGRVKGTIR